MGIHRAYSPKKSEHRVASLPFNGQERGLQKGLGLERNERKVFFWLMNAI